MISFQTWQKHLTTFLVYLHHQSLAISQYSSHLKHLPRDLHKANKDFAFEKVRNEVKLTNWMLFELNLENIFDFVLLDILLLLWSVLAIIASDVSLGSDLQLCVCMGRLGAAEHYYRESPHQTQRL